MGFFSAIVLGNDKFLKLPYTVCLKTPPQSPLNDYFLDAEPLPVSNDIVSRTSGTATMSIPDFHQYPSSDECQPPAPGSQLFRPEAWYSFTATDTSLTLLMDNLAQYPENLERLNDEHISILNAYQLGLQPYFSLYQETGNGDYLPTFCNEALDESFILANLNPSSVYLLKIYYNCLTYLTELDFSLGLSSSVDNDGDGSFSDVDCDDNNPLVHPGQTEGPYNGVDDDCDPSTPDDDLDQDGYPRAEDCDDTDAAISPGLSEIPYNGIDDDCNADTPDDDIDNDGYQLADDCEDNDASVNPAQTELIYNGKDDDCNAATLDDDLDQDGFVLADDCDDNNPTINPNKTEEPYNGIDDDCNSATLDDDLDQDGFLIADDCDDNNPTINPDAEEIPNNGIDEDCDGEDQTTSTYEISNTNVNIYPNPAIEIINIDIERQLDFQVKLYNLEGKLIKSINNSIQIKINTIPQGTYLLQIKDLTTAQKIVDKIVIGR